MVGEGGGFERGKEEWKGERMVGEGGGKEERETDKREKEE